MKTPSIPLSRVPGLAALSLVFLLTLPAVSVANPVSDLIQAVGNAIGRQGNSTGQHGRYYSNDDYNQRDNYRVNSTSADVQNALARRGYYRGPIDGDIGRQSRNAIANYQQDSGLQITGRINSSLLRSLGLN